MRGRGRGKRGGGAQDTGLEEVYRIGEEVYHHFVECQWPRILPSRLSIFRDLWFLGFQDFCDFRFSGFCDLWVLGVRGLWEKLGAWISELSGLGA